MIEKPIEIVALIRENFWKWSQSPPNTTLRPLDDSRSPHELRGSEGRTLPRLLVSYDYHMTNLHVTVT